MRIEWINEGKDAMVGDRHVAHLIDLASLYANGRYDRRPIEFEIFGDRRTHRQGLRKTLQEAQIAVEAVVTYWATRSSRDIRARGRERRLR